MILKNAISSLMLKQDLDSVTCQNVVNAMLEPGANQLQIAAFLVLLRSKSETAEELLGLIHAFSQKMIPVVTPHNVLDIVGTGGDNQKTINISTGASILAASCGVKVAKHGNRAVSSQTGSADVLEALGVRIDNTPSHISQSIDEVGIGFCFSPNFNPAFRQLRDIRKQLNIPTTLNLLGPLLNPTKPEHTLLGTFDVNLLQLFAETLRKMGTKHSMIVHGCGLDEISCIGETKIVEVSQSDIKYTTITPEEVGLSRCNIGDLEGGDAKTNADLLLAVFSNIKSKKIQAISDTIILNAATALYLYGLYPSIKEALAPVKENMCSGQALILLNKWIEFSND